MIVTREEQEKLLDKYMNDNPNISYREGIIYLEGMTAMFELIHQKMIAQIENELTKPKHNEKNN